MNKRGLIVGIILAGLFAGTVMLAAEVTVSQVAQIDKLFLLNDGGQLKSKTQLTISNTGAAFDGWVRISVPGKTPYLQSLGIIGAGTSNKVARVAELAEDGDPVGFEIFDNPSGSGTPLATDTRPQKKIRRWKLFVGHDCHVDIGYTHYQEELKDNLFPSFISSALDHIDSTATWDYIDKFRYPIESSFMILDASWHVKNADWMERLKDKLREGRISYASSFFNYVTEAFGTEEMARSHYYSSRHMTDLLGTRPERMANKSDDIGFSWAFVDSMVEAGIKYQWFKYNADHCAWRREHYGQIYYIQGRKPQNKILIWDTYFNYCEDEFSLRGTSDQTCYDKIMAKLQGLDEGSEWPHTWPYDSYMTVLSIGSDNGGIHPNIMERIKGVNRMVRDQGYAFPQVINATPGEFFEHMEKQYSDTIPAYKGTRENYWNMGAASTAYETAINKRNHDVLPFAEFLATMASVADENTAYPYEEIAAAYKNMLLYDEHTWGPASSIYDDQWRWKRNTAITSKTLTQGVLGKSTESLNRLIPATGDKTVVVYNPSSWDRTDLVEVNSAGFPVYFDLIDPEYGSTVPYQRLDQGEICFLAQGVPALGYKSFRVSARVNEPTFPSNITYSNNTIENSYFKVTLDATGSVASIVDKQHGNRELVDSGAPYKLNQFVHFTTEGIGKFSPIYSEDTIPAADLEYKPGPVLGTVAAQGTTRGAEQMQRQVILYEALPRIDIVNTVLKSPAVQGNTDEEGFFVFPFKMENFLIRHEMPSGDVRPYVDANVDNPANEQFYSSCTDHYTVNRWINISNQQDFGITFSPLDAPLVQYGERRSCLYEHAYNTLNPWIYSYVFNNKWHTNFQRTQPGMVTIAYSLTTNSGARWQDQEAGKFGAQLSNPLQAGVINGPQSGPLNGTEGQFLHIADPNVVLTAAKIAEANGEGIILRFNEVKGQDTTTQVDLSFLEPSSVVETDLVENDNLALSAHVETSSDYIEPGYQMLGHYGGHRAIDGLAGIHDSREWASMGEQNPWIKLSWPKTISIDKIVLLDRKNLTDNANSGTLSFSDGTTLPVAGIPADGGAKEVSFVAKTVDWVKFQIQGGVGPNVGLSELEVYAAPLPLNNGKISFHISGYGWKTIRLKRAVAPEQVNGLSANTVSNGTLLTWNKTTNAAYYEIFRNQGSGNFTVGSGTYIASTQENRFFEKQVRTGILNNYYYRVRAVAPGGKGAASAAVLPTSNNLNDTTPPTIPQSLQAIRLHAFRATLSWEAAKDDTYLAGYKIYRDGQHIKDLDATQTSFLDWGLAPQREYIYTVRAYDSSGNISGASNPSTVGLVYFDNPNPNNIAPLGTASASSYYNDNYTPDLAVDYIIGTWDYGEWASLGEQNPWIQIDWDTQQQVDKIVIYDRVNLTDAAQGGTLTFSDGSSITVSGIPNDGTEKTVTFAPKDVTWVRFQVQGGTGPNVGLSEFEVYRTLADYTDPAGSGIITARAEIHSQEGKEKAFDNLFSPGTQNIDWSKWLDPAGIPSAADPSWIQIELPAPVVVNTLALVSANDDYGRDPQNFRLRASTDGTWWVTLRSWTNFDFSNRFQRATLPFANENAYAYYRLEISKNEGNTINTQLCEIELLGP